MTSNSDIIIWGKMLRKLPSINRAIPRLVRGIKASKLKPDQPCGLGWAFEQAVARNSHDFCLYSGKLLSARLAIKKIADHLYIQPL